MPRSAALPSFWLLLACAACSGDKDTGQDTQLIDDWAAQDVDGDGYRAATDCDDEDASVHPGATEYCDDIDDDCDGNIDEDSAADATTWYVDEDDDGYGDADQDTASSCDQPTGYVATSGDCDDSDAGAAPNLPEACADGVDNDCDGQVDEDSDEDDEYTWYLDSDGDGYGDADQPLAGCSSGEDYVNDATDCDDADASVNPAATEICDDVDNDCDGVTDTDARDRSKWYTDADEDGYGDSGEYTLDCNQQDGTVSDATDCDDADASINPGVTETCNDVDDDCDGDTDEDLTISVYQDGDGDGYGDPDTEESACEAADGYTTDDSDCDDTDADINPAATEVCDGVDNDCDDVTDGADATDAVEWYADTDDDGYGDPDDTTPGCTTDSFSGYVLDDSDCDDDSPYVHPGANERCDDVDNDCDGTIDEDDAIDADAWYADVDDDGYGDATNSTTACDAPPDGYVADFEDCDDDDPDINPVAVELCDGIDQDCDGEEDNGAKTTYYFDNDDDTYGDADDAYDACSQPDGYVEDATDCDDDDDDIYPGATELCDGIINDCDSDTLPDDESDDDGDDYVDCDTWLGDDALSAGDCDDDDKSVHPGAATEEPDLCTVDADGDGYGDNTVSDALDAGTDCDDDDDQIFPGAAEYEPDLCTQDDDDDGYGDANASAGLDKGTDCDDSDDDTFPGAATEEPDLCTRDRDGDGWGDQNPTSDDADEGSDCDDKDDEISPDATEYCDYVDNDCDGEEDESDAKDADTWYADVDDDGYGDEDASIKACFDAPDGYTDDGDDCDDGDKAIHPGADEECDYVDNDCDGSTDEGVTTKYYPDGDSDNYGDKYATATSACSQPSGYVTDNTDCDDDEEETYPGADESCDYADNDCDGSVDEGAKNTYTIDSDGDKYGSNKASAATKDDCSAPSGYVEDDSDCDDDDDERNPGLTETCDKKDNDCDGDVDNGVLGHGSDCPATDCQEIYEDGDSDIGDGYYYIYWDGDPTKIYCLMDHTEPGGWTQITDLDFGSDSTLACSGSGAEWSNYTHYASDYGVAKVCYIDTDKHTDGIASRIFDVGGLEFEYVLGYVEGYQFGSMNAFDGHPDGITQTYVDGLSITLEDATTSDDHIYTYAVGLYRSKSGYDSNCPDSISGLDGAEPPDWLTDYSCDSGNDTTSSSEEFFGDYPLFDDEYFMTDLGATTSKDIEARLMQDQDSSQEGLYLTRITLYVR